jgi:hypothetical protein
MYEMDVEGTSDLINRISRFDKDVYRVLQGEIREITVTMKDEAQSMEPAGAALFGIMEGEQVSKGWGAWTAQRDGRDLGLDSSSGLRTDMKVSVRKVTRAGAVGIVGKVIAPRNPAAAIFLLAGSKNPQRNKGWGGNFNAELNDRFGRTFPRGMTTAWRRGYSIAADKIDAAIERARATIVG